MKVNWGKGGFSKELLEDVKLELAIGKTIECEDGPHHCYEIVNSFKWPWKAIINESDPKSGGHFVNLLSLCAQILGKPLPSLEAQEAFCKVMRVKFGIQEDGTFDRPPITDLSGKKFFS